jgi:hypothetical protein
VSRFRNSPVLLAFCAVFAACAVALIVVPMQPFPTRAAARWTEVADDQVRGVHVLGRSFNIDEARTASAPKRAFDAYATAKRGEVVSITGWALDPTTLSAAAGVAFRVDRGGWRQGRYGDPRPDIPGVFGLQPDAAPSGFAVRVETAALARGNHIVLLGTLATDRRVHAFTLPVTVHVIE